MERLRIIHDVSGNTRTIWFEEPSKEHTCEETADEVVVMKDIDGHVIGFEMLHYRPSEPLTESAMKIVDSGAGQKRDPSRYAG